MYILKNIFFSTVVVLLFVAQTHAIKTEKPQIPKADETPKFGKAHLDLSDTNTVSFKEMIARLDSFYQVQVAKGFNGSVLIGYRGKILYERYYGFSDKSSGAMWNEDTRSQLASTSKTLTSGAILLLKDKGLIDLDANVQKYIPSFPYNNITVRMLLNHRSGLPDYIKFASRPSDKTFLSNDDVVQLFSSKVPKLLFTPNTNFRYSNSNYALLASIVENVTGMKFSYFMKKFIFNPLGMHCTFAIDPSKETACTRSFCYNYSWTLQPDMHLDGVLGDKGIYSSVRDLYKWDQALYTNKLIKYSTLQEAFKPYSFEKPGVKNYGLGWRMFNYDDGTKIVYHNGWWHGNNTCFYRFIQDNFTIIVLGNRFNKNIYRQPQAIYNIMMNNDNSLSEDENEE
ncbi:MAG: serine hydrolase domain-containing protein [Chitinophagaceae bacterium]